MKIKISDPSLPDGYEFSLTGLNAILPNNEEVELEDEVVEQYESVTGKSLDEVISSNTKFGGTSPVEVLPKADAEHTDTVVKPPAESTPDTSTEE